MLPVGFEARELGSDDRRGMGEAQDRVWADLRGLDGQGGTFAELPEGYASLRISQEGLTVNGEASVSFIFSPDNWWGSGGFGSYWSYIVRGVSLPSPSRVAWLT